MRRYGILGAAVVLTMLAAGALGAEESRVRHSGLTVGLRQHADHPSMTEIPFGEGDLTYLFAYEYHEDIAFWQLGLSYTPFCSSTNAASDVNYAMTPQLHLVFTEKIFWASVGIMKTYVSAEPSYWTDIYFQLGLGLHFALSDRFDVHVGGVYAFDDWGNLGDFDTNELEWLGGLTFMF